MTDPYCYKVTAVSQTIDGDSFVVLVATAPDETRRLYVRLSGFDTPERRRPASRFEVRMAAVALGLTRDFLQGPGVLWCRLTTDRDPYGRDLADVWHEIVGIRTHLGETLFDAGLATRWPTKWHHIYDPQRDRTG